MQSPNSLSWPTSRTAPPPGKEMRTRLPLLRLAYVMSVRIQRLVPSRWVRSRLFAFGRSSWHTFLTQILGEKPENIGISRVKALGWWIHGFLSLHSCSYSVWRQFSASLPHLIKVGMLWGDSRRNSFLKWSLPFIYLLLALTSLSIIIIIICINI